MIRLAVAGAMGRMGRCVIDLASRDPRFEVAAAIDLGTPQTLPECAVLIDFTNAGGSMQWLPMCQARRIPMVIGATGHDDQQLTRITQAAGAIPIVKAANFSLGIQVLLNLVGKIATELGDEYDVEIVETHHRHKIDAPSGTALTIVEHINRAFGAPRSEDLGRPSEQNRDRKGAGEHVASPLVGGATVAFGRHGKVGERPKGQIGVHSIRMGVVVGQHEIHFSGPGETVTIRHTAHSRETFAAGALRAAAWIIGKPPGLYSMRNVLGAQ